MTANKGKVLLQVQGLEKKFDDNQVLDGITTDICQGEVVAVIGPIRFRKIYLSSFAEPSGSSNRRKDSFLKVWILQIRRLISTATVRKSVWYFSSLIFFHIRQ